MRPAVDERAGQGCNVRAAQLGGVACVLAEERAAGVVAFGIAEHSGYRSSKTFGPFAERSACPLAVATATASATGMPRSVIDVMIASLRFTSSETGSLIASAAVASSRSVASANAVKPIVTMPVQIPGTMHSFVATCPW